MSERKELIIGGLRTVVFFSEPFDPKASPILFLHGWGSRASHFFSILDQVENWIAVDLPSFGESDRPKTAWELDDFCDFVATFCEKLGIENPVIAGHSFGGAIAIRLAARGFAMRKLVLIGSAGIRHTQSFRNQSFRALSAIVRPIFRLPFLAPLRKKIYRALGSDAADAGLNEATYRAIIGEDLREEMPKITVPTTLIWGARDDATPLADGLKTHSLIAHSTLIVIENAGHFSFLDAPDEFFRHFSEAILSS